jgi:tetratricopeptide (TPR) repeat protein
MDPRLFVGVDHYDRNRFRSAIQVLESIPDDEITDRARIHLAKARFFTGDVEGADRELSKMADRIRNDPVLLANRGLILTLRGEATKAEADFRRAIEIAPDYADAYPQLGQSLIERGQYRDAIAPLTRALELNTTWGPAFQQYLRTAIRDAGRLAGLVPLLAGIRSGQFRPETGRDAADFAIVCDAHGHLGVALRLYERAFELDPALEKETISESLRLNAAIVAVRVGRRDRGRRWLEELLEEQPARLEEDLDLWVSSFQCRYAHLLCHPWYASVRDPEELAKLPEAERKAWEAFWVKVRERRDEVVEVDR